jgi:hypothetical protein
MAGTFTHWMVVEEALDKYNALPRKHPYFSSILGLNHFVCLGAVGPDYPYLTELFGNYLKVHSWADRMHYENSGEFIRCGIRNLGSLSGGAFATCLAWTCGFATHLVTDSVIHPVVNAVVGPYIFNKTEHRHCELTQDSYIFSEIKGIELNYGQYANLFGMCSGPGNTINGDLGRFWVDTLKEAHPAAAQYFNKIEPDDWHKNFLTRISSAADPSPVFRHFEEEANLSYKRTNEITPDERARFIDRVRLPGGRSGTFRTDAFNKAVLAVVDAWERLFADIENHNPDGSAGYIRNWNLDTGVNEDRADYWV